MNDQVVLIVGAGGIGSACARLLSRAGARIVLASRSEEKGEAVAREINENDGEAYVTHVDVTDMSSVINMVNDVAREFGRIDVLINAFGLGMIKPLLDINPREAKDVIDTNLYGTFLVTQSVMRYMETQKQGSIVMFPGILGKTAVKNSSVYAATRFALTGFVKSLIEENRRTGIRFSMFYLGSVNTPFWENPNIDMKVNTDKMLNPGEVAKAVYYALNQPSGSVLNEIVIQPQSEQMT
ncbi:MAG TPA: SDR family oxidoreductase [Balneolales bacterium]|nr:SDR family oxidoreductase [Balneolales bacterium]